MASVEFPEMVRKIEAACLARKDDAFVIVDACGIPVQLMGYAEMRALEAQLVGAPLPPA